MTTTLQDSQEVIAQLIDASRTLIAVGMLFRGAHANLSVRISDDRIVMTSGGNVARLTADDFAVVRTDGTVLEGTMAPTMKEIVEMHTGLYRERPDVGAVVHSHAPHITAFALAHQPLPLVYEPLLRFGLTEEVPVVPWAPRGSAESVSGILSRAKGHPGILAVMLANHGVLAFSTDLPTTVQLLTTLDEAAELTLEAKALGGAKPLPPLAIEQVRDRIREFSPTH